MLTFYDRVSGSTRTPRHILCMYIVAAGRLKVLPGEKRLENGQLRGLLWQALGHTGLSSASLSLCCGVLLEVSVRGAFQGFVFGQSLWSFGGSLVGQVVCCSPWIVPLQFGSRRLTVLQHVNLYSLENYRASLICSVSN